MHVDNKRKDVLILGEGPTQRLDDTTLTAEANIVLILNTQGKRFVLNLHYNRSSFLFVNSIKGYQFKTKNSDIKDYALCLCNILKYFTINNMKKQGLKGVIIFFSADLNPITTNDILDIHRYLMRRTWYKIMLGLTKKILIGLLTDLVNGSNHTKCVLFSNQKCIIQPTLISFHQSRSSQLSICS